MGLCSEEITTEEYVAHFDAALHKGYPRKIMHDGKEYSIIAKEFEYNEKRFLRVEVWEPSEEKIMMMATLVKSGKCRYHSPINPNFDIAQEMHGSEAGLALMGHFISTIRKFGCSFIIEEIYGEDIGYDANSKEYDNLKYNSLKEFYSKLGFEFSFSKSAGKGFVMVKNGTLNTCEEECLGKVLAANFSDKS